MVAVYMTEPIIGLRRPTETERVAECNGCHAPIVFAVIELGSLNVYDGKKSGSITTYRLCRECARLLRNEVVQVITYNEYGDAEWRQD